MSSSSWLDMSAAKTAMASSSEPIASANPFDVASSAVNVSASADGRRLAYAGFTRTANVWSIPIPASGAARVSQAEPVTTGSQEIESFDVSADGRWLLFDSDRSGIQQVYRMPLQGGEVEQLTSAPEPAMSPAVSPDGREIVYHSFRDGMRQLFVLGLEGGTPSQVTRDNAQNRMGSWSPDGRSLAFARNIFAPTQEDLIVSRDSAGKWGTPRTLLKGGEFAPWAPDGRRVLTVLKEEGEERSSLVIVPATGGAPTRIALRGGASPQSGLIWAWSADGRSVFYVGQDPKDKRSGIWRVPVTGGTPRLTLWFDEASTTLTRPWFTVDRSRIYFTRAEQQSDVWMTEVAGER